LIKKPFQFSLAPPVWTLCIENVFALFDHI